MNLTKVSVKRPLTMIMVFCIIVVFGTLGYLKMPVNLMPDIDMPVATIMTTWSGAGPSDIEEQVTDVIAESVSAIGGVDTVISISTESMSAVMMQFDFGTEMSEIMSTIRDKVDSVQSRLPDDAKRPTISQVDINAAAIGTLVLTSKLDSNSTMTYAEDTVQARLEQISGVTSADIRGGQVYKVTVDVDPTLLTRYGVTMDTVATVLSSANMTYPFGTLSEGQDQFTIRSFEELTSVDEIETLQIVTNTGKTINLSEVAKVTYDVAKSESLYRYNGESSLLIDINKQQSSNTVQLMKKVYKVIDELNEQNPEYQLVLSYDESDYINESMNSVWSTLFLSAGIAFLVILVFLRSFKASFIVALAIPLSIIGAIAAMYFSGQTLNLISVSGLMLGVGMVVDNSIVVIENIFKKREENIDLETASIIGTTSVSGAIIASTLTTVAVFLPMIFTDGMIRMMFTSLSLSIIYSLLFSVFVAITLVPAIFNKMKVGGSGISKPSFIFSKFQNAYERLLRLALNHRFITILLAIVLLASSFGLVGQIGTDLMPSADKGVMTVSIELPKGLDVQSSDYYIAMAEEKLLDIKEITSMTTSFTKEVSLMGNPNTATIALKLTSKKEREEGIKQIADRVRDILATVPDCTISISIDDSMMMSSSGFSVEVSGPDLDVLETISIDVANALKPIESFLDVTTSIADTSEEIRLHIDQKRATEWGVSVASVNSLVRMALEGSDVTTARIDSSTVDVHLQLKDGTVNGLDDLERLTVKSSKTGQEIPLSAFTTFEKHIAAKTLRKTDGQYIVTVSATLADGVDSGTAQKLANEAIAKLTLPRDYEVGQGAQTEMMMESFQSLALALVMAILLVYMVMVAQFESFKKPFIIMFSLPFGFVGVVVSLLAFGCSLSIPSFIGVILLVGIVVNNGIVLIDYIEQLRKETDMSLMECIAKGAASRLRPVLMTTLTTVLAMLPMALGIGEGAETMQPMGVVVAGGLTISTLVTLVLIPTIYLIFERRGDLKAQK
ncbi:efflux RND transporter permease subunit [Cellulosilyticum ruminicola]|uniref:efflux RND transporter permease subunit n=1 Tax=Cellulosilyticum ruminicola TaxID=425254 RepID=UPI0009FA5442|nr:efflux RND transporter permease subunit [Cellulosilyticum ruminicola]